MFGPQHNWLVTSTRSPRGLSVRLVRSSLLTLAVGAFCLTCLLMPQGAALSSTLPAVATPTAVKIQETAEAEWPHALVRLWVLLPRLLPTGN